LNIAIPVYVREGLFFSVAKEYSAQYLAYLAAKAGDCRSRLFLERRYLKRRFQPSQVVVLFLGVYSTEVMAEYFGLLTGKGLSNP